MRFILGMGMLTIVQITYTGDLLYVITLFAAKIAVPMLFLRLVASQREHFLVVSLLIGGLVLGLPAFILVAAQEAREAMVSLHPFPLNSKTTKH